MNNLNIFSKNSKINFADLYLSQAVVKLDKIFADFLQNHDEELFKEFQILKSNKENFSSKEEANILIALAKILEKFLIELFGIENESKELIQIHQELSLIYQINRDFVQRQVARKFSSNTDITEPKDIKKQIESKIKNRPYGRFLTNFELEFAKLVQTNKENATKLEELKTYAIWALFSDEGKKFHQNGSLFHLPQKIDFENLIDFTISHQLLADAK